MSESEGASQGRPLWWQHAAALVVFVLLTAAMATPLVLHPASLTAGWEGDNAFCIRLFWWAKHSVVDLGGSPFFDPASYYPLGHETASGEMFPATTFLGIPLTVLWGPVVAYNLTLLLTFVMTGFGTFLWIRWLTGNFAAGLVAGVIAAFLPFRFAHLPGHLSIISTHWVPFAFYTFDRFLDQKRLKHAIALGGCIAMVALSSWYYAYAVALMLPVYALVRSRPWRQQWDAAWWRGVGAAMATAAVLVLPFIIPYMRIRSRGGLRRGIGEMESWSLNFYDFFLPNGFNPLWQDFMLKWFPQEATQWVERGVSLGYMAIGLALVAVYWRRRHPAITAMIAVWAASYVIALGPSLHSGDRPVLMPMPRLVTAAAIKLLSLAPSLERLRDDILSHQAIGVPLPSLFMYAFVPLTSGMRVMARFGMWTGMMTAALAGFGTWFLLEKLRRRFAGAAMPVIVVLLVCGVVLIESRSQITTMPLAPRGVDLWLAEQPKDRAVLELPLEQTFRLIQNYYQTVHQNPTAFGPVGDAFEPAAAVERRAALADFPSPAAIAHLREWRVGYLLFTPALIPDWPTYQERLTAISELKFDREIEGVRVYRLE